MSKLALPIKTHRCPACHRTIYWDKMYCALCIKIEPSRAGFRLSRNQRWLKKIRLPHIKKTVDHLFVATSHHTLCVECGRKLDGGSLKHKCFFHSDSSLRLKHKLSCLLCRMSKTKVSYPLVWHGKTAIRTRICVDCLDGATLVLVPKNARRKHL